MLEFLEPPEIKQLTGACPWKKQAEWLKCQAIPHKVDGKRIIVSRSHVQSWLEGRHVISSNGPNWGKGFA